MNGRWSGWGSLALVAFQVAGCSLLPGGEAPLDSALRAGQLMVRPSDGRWWSGDAIAPRPYFTSAGRAKGKRTTRNVFEPSFSEALGARPAGTLSGMQFRVRPAGTFCAVRPAGGIPCLGPRRGEYQERLRDRTLHISLPNGLGSYRTD